MFDGECPFTYDWLQERHVMEEADMMNMQLPSRPCFHDYPVWEYNLIRRVQRLRREAEKQNGSNA